MCYNVRDRKTSPMQENTEKFNQLCRQAAAEEDPAKLIVLVQEINRLLEEKAQRLKDQRSHPPDKP